MPISRVMNNPDGSTPIPPIGGGDLNGTLAPSILGASAGTGANAIAVPRHIKFQSVPLGIPNVSTVGSPMEGMGQPVALENG